MTFRKIFLAALLLSLVVITLPAGSVQAQGTDEIKEYALDITPQPDGSLITDYAIHWCVISDAAGPLSWITLGMPNEQYEVLSYSGDVSAVSPANSGFDYLLRIDLSRQANAGDCVDVNVKVLQRGMAYLDNEKNEVSYQFIPGWFNDVPIDHLRLSWNLPSDISQVKQLVPEPNSRTDAQAVWETSLSEGDKFTVNVFYDSAAFPNLDSAQATPAPTKEPFSSASTQESSGPAAPTAETTSPPGFFESALGIVCICIIVIIAIIILIIIIRAIASSSRSYRGGGYFGGYHGSGWTGGSGSSSGGGGLFGSGGGSIGRSDRTGGGSGLFGGRGSSCACVSSGCACACAGGGRAGCSRKGFDVSSLFAEKKDRTDAG